MTRDTGVTSITPSSDVPEYSRNVRDMIVRIVQSTVFLLSIKR